MAIASTNFLTIYKRVYIDVFSDKEAIYEEKSVKMVEVWNVCSNFAAASWVACRSTLPETAVERKVRAT